jgi:putative heme-binding domain-containing protein
MKLFQSGRLPAERQGTVVEMICNRGNEHDLKVVFDRVVQPDGFTPELRRQAMGWLTDAAVTRKVLPAGDRSALQNLIAAQGAATSRPLQIAAIRLASAWKDASILPALQSLVTDASVPPALRQAAVDGLVAIGDPASRATLLQLTKPGTKLEVRMQAAAGLAGFDLATAAEAAAKALADASPQDPPDKLLDAFLNRKNGAEALADSLTRHKLSVDVAKRALRTMYSVGRSDARLSDVLSAAAGIAADAPPPSPAEIAQIVAEVESRGDPERGEKIFRRKDLNCMKCHSVSRAGGQIGPELSAVGGSSPTDYIVNSILNPNLAIKEQYITRVFVLADGRVLTGIVIDRDEVRVNVRDANGLAVSIPTADIDEELEGQSLMPQGLAKFLTRDELLDLAKFISELGKPGKYALQQAKTVQRWRVLRDAPADLTEDVPHLEHIRQLVLGAELDRWQSAYATVHGYLPLEELLPGLEIPVVILKAELDVNQADRIRVAVESTERFHLWLDDTELDPQSEIEITPSDGRHTLTLRVEISATANPRLRVELSTPEGSSANFEVVNGA